MMMNINSLPIMMTVLDSEGYQTSRKEDETVIKTTIAHVPESTETEYQSNSRSLHAQVYDVGFLERLRAELERKKTECEENRRQLASAEKMVVQLRHNFVYEVKILQKAIADSQRPHGVKKSTPDPSVLKEYTQLLVEREKLQLVHEADTATIKELRNAYSSLMAQKAKKCVCSRSRDSSTSPQRNSKKGPRPSGIQAKSTNLAPVNRITAGLSVHSFTSISIAPSQPDTLRESSTQTRSQTLSHESLSSIACEPAVAETRHVGILSRHIDVGHAVCQTGKLGTDVACMISMSSRSHEYDSEQPLINETEPTNQLGGDNVIQYMRSNAMEESFLNTSLIEHE